MVRTSLRFILGIAMGIAAGSSVLANPDGPNVVRGSVQFANPAANTLNVTNSHGAIINWQSFSIGAGEVTRFIQDSSSSAVLNRVVGGDVSSILGSLRSNGRVFLINPHGIVFGRDSVIDNRWPHCLVAGDHRC